MGIQLPVYLRVGRNPLPQILNPDYKYEYGAPVLLRDGKNVTLITTGEYSQIGVGICDNLIQKHGIELKHIHIPTLNFVDKKKLDKYLVNCKYIFVVEEHFGSGGLCDLILKVLSTTNDKFQIRCIYVEKFGETGTEEELRKKMKTDKESVETQIIKCILNKEMLR